jgi:hypothetical protein
VITLAACLELDAAHLQIVTVLRIARSRFGVYACFSVRLRCPDQLIGSIGRQPAVQPWRRASTMKSARGRPESALMAP